MQPNKNSLIGSDVKNIYPARVSTSPSSTGSPNQGNTYLGLRPRTWLAAAAVVGFLGGLVATRSDLREEIYNAVRNPGTVLEYGISAATQKYELIPYKVKPGDTLSTLLGNNQFAEDYLRERYEISDARKLEAGMKIELPVKSPVGKTLPELIEEFRKSKK